MPRYKHTDAVAGQGLFLSVNLKQQLLPGTFEHMLDQIIGTKIDISNFDSNYKNDATGASAIPPIVLLKLIFYGYSKGQYSSRKIWNLSLQNIIAKALTGDMEIHWRTIADFISGNRTLVTEIFTRVLIFCGELDLIGGETFAEDGLRLPSNASIENSGTIEQLKERVEIYKKMAEKQVSRHIAKDEKGENDEQAQEAFLKRQKELHQRIQKMQNFVRTEQDKIGKEGQALQSNVTDNESAMIKSSKGFIQGYAGIAIADGKNQVIVSAEAFGTANEGEHMPVMLDNLIENLEAVGIELDKEKPPIMLADANYFSEESLGACEERGFEAIIPDIQEKRRVDGEGNRKFDINDFKYNEEENKYECPEGKSLEHKGTATQNGVEREIYQAKLSDCKACAKFSQCSWSKKEQSKVNQGRKLLVPKDKKPVEGGSHCGKMREKLKTEEYQEKYSKRIGIVEPVFGNIRYCKGLDRFTLRGKEKVNAQWQLYCIVHNLGKCLNAYNERKKCA